MFHRVIYSWRWLSKHNNQIFMAWKGTEKFVKFDCSGALRDNSSHRHMVMSYFGKLLRLCSEHSVAAHGFLWLGWYWILVRITAISLILQSRAKYPQSTCVLKYKVSSSTRYLVLWFIPLTHGVPFTFLLFLLVACLCRLHLRNFGLGYRTTTSSIVTSLFVYHITVYHTTGAGRFLMDLLFYSTFRTTRITESI